MDVKIKKESFSSDEELLEESEIPLEFIGSSKDPLQIDYKCIPCGVAFKHKKTLKRHLNRSCHLLKQSNGTKPKRLHVKKQMQFDCPHCNFSAKRRYDLEKHITRKHDPVKRWKCSICDLLFTCDTYMRRHAKRHTAEAKAIKYFCSDCGAGYQTKSGLTAHITSRHLPDRNYKCECCKYAATNANNLKRHVELKHNVSGEKRFKCRNCDYGSNLKGCLTKHLQVHARELPEFKCKNGGCDYVGKNGEDLTKHIRRVHCRE